MDVRCRSVAGRAAKAQAPGQARIERRLFLKHSPERGLRRDPAQIDLSGFGIVAARRETAASQRAERRRLASVPAWPKQGELRCNLAKQLRRGMLEKIGGRDAIAEPGVGPQPTRREPAKLVLCFLHQPRAAQRAQATAHDGADTRPDGAC